MQWKLYFERITNEDEHSRLKATGMAYELFDSFPNSWYDHYHLAQYIESVAKEYKAPQEQTIPSWAKKVDKESYTYKQLKRQFPNITEFYMYYDCGDYYTVASTTYYDHELNELCVDTHNYYG